MSFSFFQTQQIKPFLVILKLRVSFVSLWSAWFSLHRVSICLSVDGQTKSAKKNNKTEYNHEDVFKKKTQSKECEKAQNRPRRHI